MVAIIDRTCIIANLGVGPGVLLISKLLVAIGIMKK
jgi:hypothetical protein